MTPLVFLDTETTGVHPARQVWEVGMIRRDDAGEREIGFFVDVDLAEADPFGLSVGRFYERHPYGRYLSGRSPDPFVEITHDGEFLRPRDAAHEVATWTHGAHVIGAVPSFDTVSLDALLREHQLIGAWHYHLVDVENLAVGYLAGQRKAGLAQRDEAGDLAPPWDSRQLAAALGVVQPEQDKHTALGDARWAKALFDTVLGD